MLMTTPFLELTIHTSHTSSNFSTTTNNLQFTGSVNVFTMCDLVNAAWNTPPLSWNQEE